MSHTYCCLSCTYWKPICFANWAPTSQILLPSSPGRGREICLFTELAAAILGQVSRSPELGDHPCSAAACCSITTGHPWGVAPRVCCTFSCDTCCLASHINSCCLLSLMFLPSLVRHADSKKAPNTDNQLMRCRAWLFLCICCYGDSFRQHFSSRVCHGVGFFSFCPCVLLCLSRASFMFAYIYFDTGCLCQSFTHHRIILVASLPSSPQFMLLLTDSSDICLCRRLQWDLRVWWRISYLKQTKKLCHCCCNNWHNEINNRIIWSPLDYAALNSRSFYLTFRLIFKLL